MLRHSARATPGPKRDFASVVVELRRPLINERRESDRMAETSRDKRAGTKAAVTRVICVRK